MAKAELSPQARKRRRKRLWAWLAPVLGLALVGAIFLTTSILVPQLTEGPPAPEPNEVSSSNTTQFGEAGVAYAARFGRVTINMSELPLSAADVGMEDSASAIVTAQGLLDLTMYTGQGEAGYWKGVVEYFQIETSGGAVSYMEFAEARTGWAEFQAIISRLNVGVELFGWGFDEAVQEQMTDQIGDAVRAGEATMFPIEVGTDFGLPVRGEVRCDETGFCQLVTILEPTG